MEDQGPGGEGRGHPSLQNTNSKQGDIAGHGEHEGQVPSQNASLRIRQTFFHLHADKRFPARQEGHVGLRDLCISSNRCTDRCNGVEQTGIPDALALLNTEDA